MKTSYFIAAGKMPGAISIALTAPRGYDGLVYKKLAPPPHLLKGYKNGTINWDNYREIYDILVLTGLDAGKTYDELLDLVSPGVEPILCCWEPPQKPCHRHLIAEWIETKLGIIVPEMEVSNEKAHRRISQEVRT